MQKTSQEQPNTRYSYDAVVQESRKFLSHYNDLFRKFKKCGNKKDLDQNDNFCLDGEFAKWSKGYDSDYRNALWLKVLEYAPVESKGDKQAIERLKKRSDVVERGERYKWAASKNLGKNKKAPKYWTICDIGPDRYFLELTREVVAILDRWPDEATIKEMFEDELLQIENRNARDYWRGVCALIDPQRREEIISNSEVYSNLLIKGIYLFVFYTNTKGEEVLAIIKKAHERLGKELREICIKAEGHYKRKVWDEKTKQEHSVEVTLFEKKMGEGWEALLNTVKRIEKDFLGRKGGVEQPDRYLITAYRHFIKKGLPPKEEIPMDLVSIPEGYEKDGYKKDDYGEDDTVISIKLDKINAKLEKQGYCYPYYPQRGEMVTKEKRKEKRKESGRNDFPTLNLLQLKRPERKRQVFELYQDGLTHEEIAERLGVSKKTVQRDFKEMNTD